MKGYGQKTALLQQKCDLLSIIWGKMLRISKATEYNWKKLNSDSDGKLTKRANKSRSRKRVTATGYLNDEKANALLSIVSAVGSSIESIMYSLAFSALRHKGLLCKKHVHDFLCEYSQWEESLSFDVPQGTWDSGNDVLGFIYQSLMPEGERNAAGQYYTCKNVVDYMVGGMSLSASETFLDPCCGSGAFLTAVKTSVPSNLYGFDIDPIAVFIASVNLLIKYQDKEFRPNIYCLDFLSKDMFAQGNRNGIPFRFDYIYTNPPWGSDKEGMYAGSYPAIKSKERASMVLLESLARLNSTGVLYFLLPASILKIKTHGDIRKYILANAAIRQIDLFNGRFDGVFTGYFSIKISPAETSGQSYVVTSESGSVDVLLSPEDKAAGIIALETLGDLDCSIIDKMESACHDRLSHSVWALGIVTGDNKNKVKNVKSEGMEAVYAGKNVSPFCLQGKTSYIFFDPRSFQQCAKEEFFRAEEKLIYRFIAKYPIVAYDDRQCLCLNSANILIPRLDGISVKSVAALLNSSLYRYYYSLRFPDIKVLKGNLQELPFPKLSREQDSELCGLVTAIMECSLSERYQKELDDKVYSIFGITSLEQKHIMERMQ